MGPFDPPDMVLSEQTKSTRTLLERAQAAQGHFSKFKFTSFACKIPLHPNYQHKNSYECLYETPFRVRVAIIVVFWAVRKKTKSYDLLELTSNRKERPSHVFVYQ